MKEVNLSLLRDDMVIYKKKKIQWNLQKATNTNTCVYESCRIWDQNTKTNCVSMYYQWAIKMKYKTHPLKHHQKNKEYLGINLTKYVQEVYTENCLLGEIKTQINGDTYCVHGSEDSKLLRCQFSAKWAEESVNENLRGNCQANNKLHMEMQRTYNG